MPYRWRAAVALLLVLIMPLRAIAAVAMPCCDSVIEASTASMDQSMDAAMNDMGDGHAMMSAHHDATHPNFDCCAIAMIALPVQPIVVPRYVLPQANPLRAPSIAHFVTEAPERPPRTSMTMV